MPEIFSTINYEYKKPLNFDEAISEFDIFKNLAFEACEKPEIKIVNNVRISTNSVAFNYFHIFKETCIGNNYEQYQQ
jgi:hypothetical protein